MSNKSSYLIPKAVTVVILHLVRLFVFITVIHFEFRILIVRQSEITNIRVSIKTSSKKTKFCQTNADSVVPLFPTANYTVPFITRSYHMFTISNYSELSSPNLQSKTLVEVEIQVKIVKPTGFCPWVKFDIKLIKYSFTLRILTRSLAS